jgi:hypothetical protein
VIQQQHLLAALPGHAGAKQAGGACANDDHIERMHGAGV